MLNIKSSGRWITAYITLPEPYKAENVDINSVKLWFNDNFVQAEWGRAAKSILVVKFPRSEVIKMLEYEKGKVTLKVTGLVNNAEFYGTDTIIVLVND